MRIVPSDYEIFALSALFVAASYAYRPFSGVLNKWFIGATALFFLVQYDSVTSERLPAALNLLSLAVSVFAAWNVSRMRKEGAAALAAALVLSLAVTSGYVRVFTENVFAVTIYLALVASALLYAGISKDEPKYRTAGLYVGTFMLVKILFYDLWAGVDDLSVRVLALMVTGGLMIGLSQLYGKSVKRSWTEEFSVKNFVSETRKE